VPPDGVLVPQGVPGQLNGGGGREGHQKRPHINECPHEPPFLSRFRLAHRKFPPNRVPPNSRLSAARTASRPRAAAARTTSNKISRRFCNNVILVFSLTKVWSATTMVLHL